MRSFSLNNRLVVEPYKKEGLKATVSNGFAMVSQKVEVKGLKVLVDATLSVGAGFLLHVPAGSIAYIKEELLHTQPWATKNYECDSIQGQFMVIDSAHVDFVVTPETKEK